MKKPIANSFRSLSPTDYALWLQNRTDGPRQVIFVKDVATMTYSYDVDKAEMTIVLKQNRDG